MPQERSPVLAKKPQLQKRNLKFRSESARKKYKIKTLIKKTKIKKQKTSLDLSSLAAASEKYISCNSQLEQRTDIKKYKVCIFYFVLFFCNIFQPLNKEHILFLYYNFKINHLFLKFSFHQHLTHRKAFC